MRSWLVLQALFVTAAFLATRRGSWWDLLLLGCWGLIPFERQVSSVAILSVQGRTNSSASTTSATLTLSAAPTSGNLLVAFLSHATSTRPSGTPSGTGWGTPNTTSGAGGTARSAAMWWKVAGAGESATITYNTVALTAPWDFTVVEYSGVDTVSIAPQMLTGQISAGTAYATAAVTPGSAAAGVAVMIAHGRTTSSTTAWSGHNFNSSTTGVTARVNNNLNNQAGTAGYGTAWDFIGTLPTTSSTGNATSPTSQVGTVGTLIAYAAAGSTTYQGAVAMSATHALTVSGASGTPIGSISYDFSAADGNWSGFGAPNVILNNGRLEITIDGTYWSLYRNGAPYWSLLNSAVSVEAVQIPNLGNGSTQMMLGLISRWSLNSKIDLMVGSTGSAMGLYCRTYDGVNYDYPAATTYDPVAHRFWRIRETSGTVYWEASPDYSTWTVLRSVSTSTLPFTAVDFDAAILQAGYYGTETNPGLAIYDNFNLSGSATTFQGAATMSSTNTLTVNGTREQPAAVAMTASDSLAVNGVAGRAAAVAMTASDSLTVNGVAGRAAAVAITASDSLAVNGVVTRPAAVALVTSETLTVGATSAHPKISTLTETWATQDTVKWAGYGAQVFVASGHLQINTTSSYFGLTSNNYFDLTSDAGSIEVPQVPNLGNGSTSAYYQLVLDNNNALYISWEDGPLHVGYKLAGVSNQIDIPYSPIAHKIWRIRESGGIVYWETSATGSSWQVQRQLTAPIAVTGLQVSFSSGYWGTETAPGYAVFDNFNASYTPSSPPGTARVFYVDPAGSDANDGLGTGTAWATIAKVNSTVLYPGDQVLFKRGSSFSGTISVSTSGSSGSPITIGAYGTGALPIVDGGGASHTAGTLRTGEIFGSWITADSIEFRGSKDYGVLINGTDCIVQGCSIRWGTFGVFQTPSAARAKILYNTFIDVNVGIIGPGTNDDAGASGVVLEGDSAEVAYNVVSGCFFTSPDYGVDGQALEIYGATNAVIHHNNVSECMAFAEIGNPSSNNNTYYNNVYTSSLAGGTAFAVHGQYMDDGVTPNPFGPVLGTKIYHNSVHLTATDSAASALWMSPGGEVDLRNNVFVVDGAAKMVTIGATSRTVTEAGNVFYNTAGNSTNYSLPAGLNATSIIADPLFVGPTDLRIRTGSPAIDRGINLGYTTDFAGNVRPQGAAPDSGAYEGATLTGVTGTVSMTGTGTLTVGGVVTRPAAVSVTSTDSLTVNGVVTRPAVVLMTAADTLTTNAVREQPSVVAQIAAHTLTVNGISTRQAVASLSAVHTLTPTSTGSSVLQGVVAMVATDTVTAAAVRTTAGTVNMTAADVLTVNGVREQLAVVGMTAFDVLTVAGTIIVSAAAALVETHSLVVTALLALAAAAAMVAIETLVPNGVVTRPASVSMTATSTLTADGTVSRAGAVAMIGTGTLTANATVTPATNATISMTAADTLNVVGTLTERAIAAMTGTDTLTANGSALVTYQGAAAMTAVDTLTADGRREYPASVSMTSANTVSAIAFMAAFGSVSIVTIDTLTANAITTEPVSAILASTETLTVSAYLVLPSTVTMTSAHVLSVTGVREQLGTVAMVSIDTLASSGIVLKTASVSMTASGTLNVIAYATVFTTSTLVAAETLTVSGVRILIGASDMASTDTLTASAIAVGATSVFMSATDTLTSAGRLVEVAAVAMVSTDTLTATTASIVTYQGVVSMVETSTFTSDGIVTRSAVVAMVASEITTAAGQVSMVAVVSMVGADTLVTDGIRTVNATASMIAVQTLLVTGIIGAAASVIMASADVLTVNGVVAPAGSVALVSTEILTAAGQRILLAAVAIVASEITTADGTGIPLILGVVAMTALGQLIIVGTVVRPAVVLISSAHALLSDGTPGRVASVPLVGASVLTATATTIKVGLVALLATHSLGTAGTLTARAIVAMISFHSLLAAVQGSRVWVRHPSTGLLVQADVMVRNPAKGNAFEASEVMVRDPSTGQFVSLPTG